MPNASALGPGAIALEVATTVTAVQVRLASSSTATAHAMYVSWCAQAARSVDKPRVMFAMPMAPVPPRVSEEVPDRRQYVTAPDST